MRTIAIANQKGGVGKTTTAVNLAVGLAHMGKRVLLIDMDPQANATFSIIGNEDEPPLTVYDLLSENCSVSNVRFPTSEPLLDIFPSNIDLAGAEVELISSIGGQIRLRNTLAHAPLPYDYLIVDTPPSLGLLTINALAAVNEVIIPVSTSVFALKGIIKLEHTIEQVKTRLNTPTLHISGVLCTMFENTLVAKDVVENIRGRFGEKLFDTLITKNVKIEEAHSHEGSIYSYAPTSTGAKNYSAFIEEVVSRG